MDLRCRKGEHHATIQGGRNLIKVVGDRRESLRSSRNPGSVGRDRNSSDDKRIGNLPMGEKTGRIGDPLIYKNEKARTEVEAMHGRQILGIDVVYPSTPAISGVRQEKNPAPTGLGKPPVQPGLDSLRNGVRKSRDLRLKRDVAIKTLPPGFSGDRNRVARFDREARAASALNHPNAVDFAHPAASEHRHNFEIAELFSRLQRGRTFGDGGERRTIQQRIAGISHPQQRFHLDAKLFVAAASIPQKLAARRLAGSCCAASNSSSICFQRSACIARHFTFEPSFRQTPVPNHRVGVNPQRFGGFFYAQPAEIAHLHHLSLAWIQPGQIA